MKVAMVGLGYWGEKVLRNLVRLVTVKRVLAIDPDESRHAALRELYPGMEFACSVEDGLADSDVGAAILATPVETHAPLAARFLAGGRHVLVEKPLAASVRDARALVELGRERDLLVMAGHTFLFSPRLEVVTDAIRRGQIGRLHYVTASRLNLGLYRNDINVIWDLAPHDLSIVLHVLDEKPLTVQTTAQSSVRPGVPDVAFVNLTFPSGAIASLTVSWRAPRKVRQTLFVGDEGMIVYDDTQPDEPVKIYDRGVMTTESANFGEHQLTYRYGDTIAPHVPPHEPLFLELEHFLSCIEEGTPCRSAGWFGLSVVEALEAADRSWRLGGAPVTLSPAGVTRTA
jgi:predicted dehydrogenase